MNRIQRVFLLVASSACLFWSCGPKPPASLSSRTVIGERASADSQGLSADEQADRLEMSKVEEEIHKSPRDPEGYYKAGMISLKIGQWDGARKLFERALAIKPDYAEAMYRLAYAWEQSG